MRSVVKIQHNLVILPKYGHATSKCGHIILNVTFIYIYILTFVYYHSQVFGFFCLFVFLRELPFSYVFLHMDAVF